MKHTTIVAIGLMALLSSGCTKKPASLQKYSCDCVHANSSGQAVYQNYTLEAPTEDSATRACKIQDSLTKSSYGPTGSSCYLN